MFPIFLKCFDGCTEDYLLFYDNQNKRYDLASVEKSIRLVKRSNKIVDVMSYIKKDMNGCNPLYHIWRFNSNPRCPNCRSELIEDENMSFMGLDEFYE